jgi:aminobutyraldehyde dehydrogenase
MAPRGIGTEPNLIDGALEEMSGDTDEVIDPATEGVIGYVPRASSGDVTRAIEAAHRALPRWRQTTPAERAATLLAIAAAIEMRANDYAAADSRNVGMPLAFARATVAAAVDTLRFFAGAARTSAGLPAAEYVTGMTSLMRREPIGVVAQLLPWNVPLLMTAWKLGPALAAGNTVVLKPSQRTPLSALLLARALADGLVPAGVVNIVTGTHDEVGVTLATHPLVRMVALTGSVSAGSTIAGLAAPLGKRLHLELGGKTPIIVARDADVGRAATGIVRGALDNSGQDCTAATRVLVVDPVFEPLLAALAARMVTVRVGPPSDPTSQMGPVISAQHRDAILEAIAAAVAAGARVVVGGGVLAGPGFYVRPTLLADIEPDARVLRTEIFGPVVTIERCMDEDEAVERANASDFGLAAGIWTSSISRALTIAARLEAGKIWINDHHRDATEMPHGGMKRSGHGTDLSVFALSDYTVLKAIHLALDDRHADLDADGVSPG